MSELIEVLKRRDAKREAQKQNRATAMQRHGFTPSALGKPMVNSPSWLPPMQPDYTNPGDGSLENYVQNHFTRNGGHNLDARGQSDLIKQSTAAYYALPLDQRSKYAPATKAGGAKTATPPGAQAPAFSVPTDAQIKRATEQLPGQVAQAVSALSVPAVAPSAGAAKEAVNIATSTRPTPTNINQQWNPEQIARAQASGVNDPRRGTAPAYGNGLVYSSGGSSDIARVKPVQSPSVLPVPAGQSTPTRTAAQVVAGLDQKYPAVAAASKSTLPALPSNEQMNDTIGAARASRENLNAVMQKYDPNAPKAATVAAAPPVFQSPTAKPVVVAAQSSVLPPPVSFSNNPTSTIQNVAGGVVGPTTSAPIVAATPRPVLPPPSDSRVKVDPNMKLLSQNETEGRATTVQTPEQKQAALDAAAEKGRLARRPGLVKVGAAAGKAVDAGITAAGDAATAINTETPKIAAGALQAGDDSVRKLTTAVSSLLKPAAGWLAGSDELSLEERAAAENRRKTSLQARGPVSAAASIPASSSLGNVKAPPVRAAVVAKKKPEDLAGAQ